jgi:hypothetical protein
LAFPGSSDPKIFIIHKKYDTIHTCVVIKIVRKDSGLYITLYINSKGPDSSGLKSHLDPGSNSFQDLILSYIIKRLCDKLACIINILVINIVVYIQVDISLTLMIACVVTMHVSYSKGDGLRFLAALLYFNCCRVLTS